MVIMRSINLPKAILATWINEQKWPFCHWIYFQVMSFVIPCVRWYTSSSRSSISNPPVLNYLLFLFYHSLWFSSFKVRFGSNRQLKIREIGPVVLKFIKKNCEQYFGVEAYISFTWELHPQEFVPFKNCFRLCPSPPANNLALFIRVVLT